jgi:hypothetical protein
MTDQDEKPERSTRVMCERIAETVLDLFVDRLLEELKQVEDGTVDRHRISELARTFKGDEQYKYLRRVQSVAEAWLGAMERDHWEQLRKRPFDRLLVKRFAHLFPPAESLQDGTGISRRVLPGLFAAFEKLAGSEFVGQCRGAGRRLFQEFRDEHGADFDWPDYYASPSANDLLDDLMVVIAWSFKDIERRLDWMLATVNANLAAPEDYAFEGDGVETWRLDRTGLLAILRALFIDFPEQLGNEDLRRHFLQRYGEDACATVEAVVDNLQVAA